MIARKITLTFLAMLIMGFASGYVLKDLKISFMLYHIGGFGALGLLACVVGFISSKKGHRYWLALTIALAISILLGLIAAYLVPPTGDGGRPAACGGSVSLVVALIFIVVWAFVKRRDKVSLNQIDEV